MKKDDFNHTKYYENRELSWLKFDARILGEAKDRKNPLFERLKFLSITASNLDEFFMIRVASLKDMVNADYKKTDIAGMKPAEQLEAIYARTHELVKEQYSIYNRSLLLQLKQNGLIVIKCHEDMTKEQAEYADHYFIENVYPVLTPMAVDSSRPFPLIMNKSLNIGALISKKSKKRELDFATVQVPAGLSRIVRLPDSDDGNAVVILLEEIIERNISKLFLNYDVVCAHPYRIMRNADLTIDEDEAADLLKEIQKQLKKRQWGEVIRLEAEQSMDPQLLKYLKNELQIKNDGIYKINGPLDLTFLMKMYGMDGFEHLKIPSFKPQPHPRLRGDYNIFDEIAKGDILLHHPYETFDPVVEFVKQAAVDKRALAIKQTLYRVSGNSPIIKALAQAAENGKQVTVLVELKARFDEEHNIVWAKMLEKAGCHVIYGLVGLKTHSKIALVVRSEENGIRRYVHLGTGNYNDATAKLYTDMGLLTCSDSIGEDATAVFNMLSGYSEPLAWNKLSVAPLWLRERFLNLIERECEYAKEGKKAKIIAKINSLCDKQMIASLYEASSCGVEIHLIVRGICCLKTGIPNVSENITVRSIIGNFLEHARIFYFYNGGKEEVYMSSADWMPRNLDKRVELMFPIEDQDLKSEVIEILNIQLKDNVKAQELKADGSYARISAKRKEKICAQEYFCKKAKEQGAVKKNVHNDRLFVPKENLENNSDTE